MNYELNKVTVRSQYAFSQYAPLRPIYATEGQFLNQFIWANFYDTRYITTEDALFFLITVRGERCTMLPYCKLENSAKVFNEICAYFHEELDKKLTMYLADEAFVTALREQIPDFEEHFEITEDRDSFDYVYEAEKLRTFGGRALHKKKNHINAFLKEYEGRWEYRPLSCSSASEIEAFHRRWLSDHEDSTRGDSLLSERVGIGRIFENCRDIDCEIAGIYIDGRLEAYTIGSYNPITKYAYIHIEKANADINGLYPFICQQFLINAFPEAEFSNREDDLGEEGLRHSKLSYKPVRLEAKYIIREK